jgi:protein TonB
VPSPPPAKPPPIPAQRLGLAPPRSLTPDPRAQPAPPQPGPTPAEKPTPTTEPAKQEAAKPEPEQQQAAAAPPPPPEPKLEQALPPVEAPPPPLTAQDFPKAAPPPPPKTPPPPPPPQRAQAPPPPTPPPRQQLQPSPLSTAPQQRAPADSQAAARPSPLTNPASQYGQRKAEDDYLWQVSRILSQHQQFVRNVTTEQGSVVLRMTVARDGRLVDAGLSQSSGVAALDATALNLIRQAGPYPRLPPDIAGAQHSFVLPLHFRRSN